MSELHQKLRNESAKHKRKMNSLIFLKRCRNNLIVPNGFRIKMVAVKTCTQQVAAKRKQLEHRTIRVRIREIRKEIDLAKMYRTKLFEKMAEVMEEMDLRSLEDDLRSVEFYENRRVKKEANREV